VPVFPSGAGALNCGDGHATVPGAGGLPTTPAQCNLAIYPHHQPTAYITNWTASVQRSFGSNISLNVAYVGNHLTGAMMFIDLNQPTVGFSQANRGLAGGIGSVARRPYNAKFPYFGQILQYGPGGEANYNALQVTLRKRTSHGLTFNADYTWAHALNSTVGTNNPYVEDSTNPEASYGDSGQPRNHFAITASYDIPGVKSPGHLLEGWSLNSVVNYLSGSGINLTDRSIDYAGIGNIRGGLKSSATFWSLFGSPGDFNTLGRVTQQTCYAVNGSRMANAGCTIVAATPDASNFPAACRDAAAAEPVNSAMNAVAPGISSGILELVGGTIGGVKQAAFGCWVSPNGRSAIIPPAQGTFGNMTKNELHGAPFSDWDLSVTKSTKFNERLTAEFRAEFFNVINSPVYTTDTNRSVGSPTSANFGLSTGTPNGANPINGTGGSRLIQLGLKLKF